MGKTRKQRKRWIKEYAAYNRDTLHLKHMCEYYRMHELSNRDWRHIYKSTIIYDPTKKQLSSPSGRP